MSYHKKSKLDDAGEVSPRADIYAQVTSKICAELEKGVRPWSKPWGNRNGTPRPCFIRPLRANGVPYTGVNTLLLWAESANKGYSAPHWMTFKQALELGACVRKGEKASQVVYANTFTKIETGESGETSETKIPFLKGYSVFNVEQIDGLPDLYKPTLAPIAPVAPSDHKQRMERVDAFVTATGAKVAHGGQRAFYAPSHDSVQMPDFAEFVDSESYYGTLLHELTHWTSHPSRCDRVLGKRFGDSAYACEELIAELGAAFLCADLGVTSEPRADHAQYLQSWLSVLRADKRAIFTAASLAQKASDHLHGLQVAKAA